MATLRSQMSATHGFVERNWALTRRYIGRDVVWLVYGTVSTPTCCSSVPAFTTR